jgi:hypothetical protein
MTPEAASLRNNAAAALNRTAVAKAEGLVPPPEIPACAGMTENAALVQIKPDMV